MDYRDRQTEEFLSKIVGCQFVLIDGVSIDAIDVKQTRQLSRLTANNPDYVAGIAETMRLGAFVRPVILKKGAKDKFIGLDGIHRVKACELIQRETTPAYIVDVDDDQAQFIASCANVYLNGQGLSEDERRQHFLDQVRQHSPDLSAPNVLRKPLIKRIAHVLSVSSGTAKRWVDVEVFKARVSRLGLTLPPSDEGHRTGQRGEGWMLAVAELTDEELQAFWLVLAGAGAPAIGRVAKELKRCTSTQARQDAAKALIPTVNPSVRVMSQSEADKDRRMAGQIRSHGAGLIKVASEFARLAAKYEDVRATLTTLRGALDKVTDDEVALTLAG